MLVNYWWFGWSGTTPALFVVWWIGYRQIIRNRVYCRTSIVRSIIYWYLWMERISSRTGWPTQKCICWNRKIKCISILLPIFPKSGSDIHILIICIFFNQFRPLLHQGNVFFAKFSQTKGKRAIYLFHIVSFLPLPSRECIFQWMFAREQGLGCCDFLLSRIASPNYDFVFNLMNELRLCTGDSTKHVRTIVCVNYYWKIF